MESFESSSEKVILKLCARLKCRLQPNRPEENNREKIKTTLRWFKTDAFCAIVVVIGELTTLYDRCGNDF